MLLHLVPIDLDLLPWIQWSSKVWLGDHWCSLSPQNQRDQGFRSKKVWWYWCVGLTVGSWAEPKLAQLYMSVPKPGIELNHPSEILLNSGYNWTGRTLARAEPKQNHNKRFKGFSPWSSSIICVHPYSVSAEYHQHLGCSAEHESKTSVADLQFPLGNLQR